MRLEVNGYTDTSGTPQYGQGRRSAARIRRHRGVAPMSVKVALAGVKKAPPSP
jgi:hypothetical protein